MVVIYFLLLIPYLNTSDSLFVQFVAFVLKIIQYLVYGNSVVPSGVGSTVGFVGAFVGASVGASVGSEVGFGVVGRASDSGAQDS